MREKIKQESMMKIRYLICFCMGFLNSCAYLNSGSTQRVRINTVENDSIFINGKYLGQKNVSATLLKKNSYVINFRNESQATKTELVRTKVDRNVLWDLVFFEYYSVDATTGSYRKIIDGENYKTITQSEGDEVMANLLKKENQQRTRLVNSGWRIFLLASLGGGFAQLAGDEKYHGALEKGFQGSFYALSFGALVSIGYNIWASINAVKNINNLNQEMEFR